MKKMVELRVCDEEGCEQESIEDEYKCYLCDKDLCYDHLAEFEASMKIRNILDATPPLKEVYLCKSCAKDLMGDLWAKLKKDG